MNDQRSSQGQPDNQNQQQQQQSDQRHDSRKLVANKDQLDSRENLELNDADEAGGHNRKATHEGDEAKTEQNDRRGMPPASGA
jgi:hypothetical protein